MYCGVSASNLLALESHLAEVLVIGFLVVEGAHVEANAPSKLRVTTHMRVTWKVNDRGSLVIQKRRARWNTAEVATGATTRNIERSMVVLKDGSLLNNALICSW